jgi:di/tricarboxylate transporter
MIGGIQQFIDANSAVIGLVLLALIFISFVLERYPATVIAVAGACAYLLLGLLDAQAFFTAFANPAPITIAAMFILSGALIRTGTLDAAANIITRRAQKHPRLALIELMIGVFFISAFMNNTPVVIVLIPIMAKLAHATGYSLKRLLIPLSYFAIMGGTTTLIGTSTNLIVDGVAREEGLAPFGIFEITLYGLVASAAGAVTLLLLGRWLLPHGEPEQLYRSSEHTDFLTELLVTEESEAIGRLVGEDASLKRGEVLALKRDGQLLRGDLANEVMKAGDRLVLRVELPELLSLRTSKRFEVGMIGVGDAPANSEALVEATVAPSHPSLGRRLAEIPFLSRLPVRILGITRHHHLPGPDLTNSRIRAADRLLVTGSLDAIRRMYDNPNLLGVGQTRARAFRRRKAPIAIAALTAVVGLAAFDVM